MTATWHPLLTAYVERRYAPRLVSKHTPTPTQRKPDSGRSRKAASKSMRLFAGPPGGSGLRVIRTSMIA